MRGALLASASQGLAPAVVGAPPFLFFGGPRLRQVPEHGGDVLSMVSELMIGWLKHLEPKSCPSPC